MILKFIRLKLKLISCAFLFLIASISSDFAKSDSLRKTGDILRHLNPVVAALFATQEKGLGHFAIIHAQSMSIVLLSREVLSKTKWKICERPHKDGKPVNYQGMVSGHVMSAWTSAAYSRTFNQEYKWISIPLYATAAFTGYSRVHSKCHTVAQVVTAAVLSEGVVYLNKVIGWSDCYTGFDIQFGDKECFCNFKIKF